MKQKAFNLVELLVVVAIISILASLLLPSLSKSRKLAKRAVCLSNLKQFGSAITMVTAQNNMVVPKQAKVGGYETPYAVNYTSDDNRLNAQELNKFLGDDTFDITNGKIGNVAKCPNAANADVFQQFNDPNVGDTYYPDHNSYLFTYQYFGHSQLGNRNNGADQILTERFLEPDRIMMTDFTLRNAAGRRWYNHEDSNVRLNSSGGLTYSGVMEVKGMSRLWGDGRAIWHDVSAKDRIEMEQQNPPNIPYYRTRTDNAYFGSVSALPVP